MSAVHRRQESSALRSSKRAVAISGSRRERFATHFGVPVEKKELFLCSCLAFPLPSSPLSIGLSCFILVFLRVRGTLCRRGKTLSESKRVQHKGSTHRSGSRSIRRCRGDHSPFGTPQHLWGAEANCGQGKKFDDLQQQVCGEAFLLRRYARGIRVT